MTSSFAARYAVIRIPTPETIVIPDMRLGRSSFVFDSRSLGYLVDEVDYATLQDKRWPRRVGPFNQGNLGSCTGNGSVGVLATEPYFDTLSPEVQASLNEALCVSVYSDATKIDPFSGTYPPTDTGSNGISVAKVLQTRGLISGYLHATTLNAMLTALQFGPVIVGVNWYEGFDSPDSSGGVSISGRVRGGHEFEVNEVDIANQRLGAVQSWGPSWGLNGTFNFSFADMTRLLSEQGDCTSFVPIDAPAPTPTTGNYALTSDDAAALDLFAGRRHVAPISVAAAAAWKRAVKVG